MDNNNSNVLNNNFFSYHKMNNEHHSSALLEPINELNDIPLNLETVSKEQLNTKDNIADVNVISPLPQPPSIKNINELNILPTHSDNNQKSTSNSNQKEVILVVSENLNQQQKSCNKQKQYKNGQLLTTVFPSNLHCAWITPPNYDCKMPTILSNSLTTSIYASILNSIVSDLRFFSYSVLYSRITPLWLIFSIIILLTVLASSPSGGFFIMLFALIWLIMLVIGLLLCVLIRKYIMLSLRNLFKDVNKTALQYKILVGVSDKGQLSCHKVALLFIYFDVSGCKEDTLKLLRIEQGIAKSPISLSDKEMLQKSEELVCQYSQQYAKAYMKRKFLFPTRPSEGVSEFRPKHSERNLCICQYIEQEYFGKNDAKKSAPWYERVFSI